MRFAENKNIFNPNQHGFRGNRGCENQLVELVSDLSSGLHNSDEIEACVLDFSKAFDKVSHCKLVKKLYRLGVSYQVCSWIKDYLSGR
jgi:hypothetical protein